MSIKKGDLVMVVKPTECCGLPYGLGLIFKVEETLTNAGSCGQCGRQSDSISIAFGSGGRSVFPFRSLKKIEPPADGDSLPTRKDLEVPA